MQRAQPSLFTPVLIAGSLIIIISFGVRSAFGLFQIPIAETFGWLRVEYSMAIAIQNLAWGIGQPMFAALADRFGARLALVLGAFVYSAGMLLSAIAITPEQHQMLGILVGFGVAGTAFGVILAVVGKAAAPENRSMALGIATAAGSGGQIIGPPAVEAMLGVMPWQSVFVVLGIAVLAILLLVPFIREPAQQAESGAPVPMGAALGRAFRDPSYSLIFVGFFSCGYQLGFITAHFPAFVTEVCGPIDPAGILAGLGITTTSALGAIAIALIGVANIGGTLAAGWFGQRYSKKYGLAAIYVARTLVSAAFILTPMTPGTVILFSLIMGTLWLATVPLTAGLVGQIYGMKYMGTLYGFVFLSHQIGGFLGIWLGGEMYDITGDYTLVWWIGIGVGAFSALVHLPIRERPLEARGAAA